MAEASVYDYRHSILNIGTQNDVFMAVPTVSIAVYVLLALGIILVALALCLLFGIYAVRSQNAFIRFRIAARKHAAREAKQVTARSVASQRYDWIPGVSLRYIFRSIIRGGARSFAVPGIIAALLLFASLFSGIRKGYGDELATVYDDIPVAVYFSDSKGRQLEHLSINARWVVEIERTGYTKDTWFTRNERYRYLYLSEYADGSRGERPVDFEIPRGQYSYETFEEQYTKMTDVFIHTNQLNIAREFEYTQTPDIIWDEGYNWGGKDTGYQNALFSKQFVQEHGLSLGDTVALSIFLNDSDIVFNDTVFFNVAGIYTSEVNRQAVFAYEDIFSSGDQIPIYQTVGFTMFDTRELSEFKDWLSERYDQLGRAGRNRRWIVVDDRALYKSVDSLTRYIQYMDLLYPVMLGATVVIGFIVSGLLLKSRSGEINTLRSLGAGKARVFGAFFMEPVLLCLPGIAIGIGFAALALGGAGDITWANVPLIVLCYLTGAATAVVHTYQKAVMLSRAASE
jgi:hypothetical protein